MKPNHCAIVTDEGEDVNGRTSGAIAPHGICALWEPNEKEIKQQDIKKPMRCGEYYAKGIMKFQKELGLHVNRVRHLGLYEIEDDAGETTELSNEITII